MICYRSGTNLIQILYQSYTDLVPSGTDLNLLQICYQSDTDMVPKWYGCGTKVVWMWYQSGKDVVKNAYSPHPTNSDNCTNDQEHSCDYMPAKKIRILKGYFFYQLTTR